MAARYTYDAWGKPLTITDGNGVDVSEDPNHIANLNPLRYRGYYWDSETGLYYCQSRYYDPETGRFINADGMVDTGQGIIGNNMFAYCLNNPVNRLDPSGQASSQEIQNIIDELLKRKKSTGKTLADLLNVKRAEAAARAAPKPNSFQRDFALYDSRRFDPLKLFHEQIFGGSFSGPTANLKDHELGLAALDISLYKGGWQWKYVELNPLNAGQASAYLGKGKNYFGLGAMATAWAPDFTLKINGWEITLGADVGSIGAILGVHKGKVKLGGAAAVGFHLEIGPS